MTMLVLGKVLTNFTSLLQCLKKKITLHFQVIPIQRILEHVE